MDAGTVRQTPAWRRRVAMFHARMARAVLRTVAKELDGLTPTEHHSAIAALTALDDLIDAVASAGQAEANAHDALERVL